MRVYFCVQYNTDYAHDVKHNLPIIFSHRLLKANYGIM